MWFLDAALPFVLDILQQTRPNLWKQRVVENRLLDLICTDPALLQLRLLSVADRELCTAHLGCQLCRSCWR